jgi:YihY family inner membrane protein
MSVAQLVPETWELSGDDARKTLATTGRTRLLADAWTRLRAADGFSHIRSLAFLVSLLLLQGVIVLVGVAAALGDTDVSATIVRAVTSAAPGPAGRVLTKTVFHAYSTGTSRQYAGLVLVGLAALVTSTTFMGQIERALNRLYGIEQDRPTVQKYGRALVLALTAGVLSTAAFATFALGHAIGQGIGDANVAQGWGLVRWPLALVLMAAAMALLFRWSPRRRQPAWTWLAFASTVSVVLWSLATVALGWFFDSSTTFSRTYGPLAGVVALMLWAFASSFAILYGAALAAQLEAVRAGASAPRDAVKVAAADDASGDGPSAAPVAGASGLVGTAR